MPEVEEIQTTDAATAVTTGDDIAAAPHSASPSGDDSVATVAVATGETTADADAPKTAAEADDAAPVAAAASAGPAPRKALTPEQHERKLLRDRERRAANSRKMQAVAAMQNPDYATEMSQSDRDIPFQKRLSAMLQAEDKARTKSVAESQRRRAEGKPPATRRF
jgi:hypothetical protein